MLGNKSEVTLQIQHPTRSKLSTWFKIQVSALLSLQQQPTVLDGTWNDSGFEKKKDVL